MPERCPACDTPVVQAPGEVMHRCPNRACPARGFEWLKHFVSRGAMDIDGVGEKLVARLLELGLVTRPHDLYALTVDDLLPLEGFQQRSAENVIALDRRVAAAAVRQRAVRARHPARRLRERRSCWPTSSGRSTRWRHAGAEEIAAVEGIGPVIAESVSSWFLDEEHDEVVEGLARGRRPDERAAAGRAPRGAAERQGRGGDRVDRGAHARLDPRAPGGAGREGDGLRVEEDGLPGGRRGRRLEAWPRPRSWACRW